MKGGAGTALGLVLAALLLYSPWIVSWYGRADGFQGQGTASGAIFDADGLTCACYYAIPFGTTMTVCNPENGACVQVQCTDRGPFHWTEEGWSFISPYRLDLSEAAFRQIADPGQGVIFGAEVWIGDPDEESAESEDEGDLS
ncbi:MAG: septal ring lytic transglycosylase RlpA family protein [Bacteroidetes bacterium]|nr:septal ring lytic transglycosylase RlpA family protein [Bacteroidota bacterium]MCL5026317.1 septal ring lytic transglycosylase RlpA family protein [Chloroflexota bacterium]